MKTATKVIIAISIITVWIVSMCIFIPYDLDTVQLPDEEANNFFNTAHNFNVEYYMSDYFEDVAGVRKALETADYRCLSDEESDRVYISYTYRFDKGNTSSVTFFTLDSKNYLMFTLLWQNERKLSFMDISYVIYETDEFPEAVTENFRTSGRTISQPASFATRITSS